MVAKTIQRKNKNSPSSTEARLLGVSYPGRCKRGAQKGFQQQQHCWNKWQGARGGLEANTSLDVWDLVFSNLTLMPIVLPDTCSLACVGGWEDHCHHISVNFSSHLLFPFLGLAQQMVPNPNESYSFCRSNTALLSEYYGLDSWQGPLDSTSSLLSCLPLGPPISTDPVSGSPLLFLGLCGSLPYWSLWVWSHAVPNSSHSSYCFQSEILKIQ